MSIRKWWWGGNDDVYECNKITVQCSVDVTFNHADV